MVIKSDLKQFNDGASITSDGKLFHMLAILQVKKLALAL